MADYKKLEEAPAEFEPQVEAGATFEATYPTAKERALVAAGWIEPVKKKGDK